MGVGFCEKSQRPAPFFAFIRRFSSGSKNVLTGFPTLGMTREWLLQDNITPAETIVEMMFRSMPEDLRKIYFSL